MEQMQNRSINLTIKETCRFLREKNDFIILSHASPDGDTIGAAAALCISLRRLGKRAFVRCADPFPDKFSYIYKGLTNGDYVPAAVVAVDVADPKLLGNIREEYPSIDLCIDHHISNTRYAQRLLLDATASAACEIIWSLCAAWGIAPDRQTANALFTGISTDTGCFKFSNVTPRTHRIAASLLEAGADGAAINRLMFDTKSKARIEVERLALDSLLFFHNNQCAMVSVTKAMKEQTGCDEGDLEGITALSRTIEGVLVGVTIREKDNGRYKVSVRTHAPIDASQLCGELGGGGHARAAGCELDGPLSRVQEVLSTLVGKYLDEI